MTFFVEFEFRSLTDSLYWFPLYIEADAPEQARDYVERIRTGLCQNYSLISQSRIIPVFTSFDSQKVAEYREKRATGTPQALNVTQWQMRTLGGAPDISFDRQTDEEIASLPDHLLHTASGPVTLAIGYQYSFPVHAITTTGSHDEFLLINVVTPKRTF